ncbi:MAG TPA: segregation/condensation protein A [Candidatus Polarisedimenticolia bacterium]|nr:segregation/condensation protein A [Candidatus Polarisedimenticolia bacterium]
MPSESDHPAPSPESGGFDPAASGTEEGASPVAGTGYRVRLTAFEGPLDLLLHLIRVNEIDLFNIPIVSITRQYNETLDLMRELNLEVAGEYLVMAATLLHIKSKMLLPPDPEAAVSGPSDPRAELVRQLEEYRRYREVALALGQAEFEQNRTWSRPASLVTGFEGEAAVVADLFSLLGAFKRILDTLSRQEQLALKRERISLLDRIHWVLDRLREMRRAPFSSLFEPGASRADLIVTFLALLELIRLQVIGAAQDVRFGEIEIVLLEEPDQIRIDAERVLDA